MQIKKTYKDLNPGLIYDELRDFILKQGVILSESKLETYQLQGNSSEFTSRGTLTFKASEGGPECIRAHVVGSATMETKVLLNIDEQLFSGPKLEALQGDLDFVFGSYEVKPRP